MAPLYHSHKIVYIDVFACISLNRDIAEKLWLKNNPEKKTVGRYIADDLLKPAFNKAMTEQVNNYVSKFVNYSTKKVVDSILNSPGFKEKSRKK